MQSAALGDVKNKIDVIIARPTDKREGPLQIDKDRAVIVGFSTTTTQHAECIATVLSDDMM